MEKQRTASKGCNLPENQAAKNSMPVNQVRDVNNRNILKDPVLCTQFLKDYVDGVLFRDLKPEDIEDESEKYQAYLGVEFESDTVKKIRINRVPADSEGDDIPLYLLSLVEHKSRVDYNVSMQILRYMVCIWNEYGKEMMSLKKGDIRNKGFRYPPILPIVYYEGKEDWTADMHLGNRIMMKELFEKYIPNFTYKLVRNHDYSNEELLENKDEMSLLMMLGKAQTAEDIHQLLEVEHEKVDAIIQKAPEHILEMIASTLWSLCMKMNLPQNEAEQCVRKVRERQMGYWFENMEKMDIQAERQNTAEAREELEKTKEKLSKAEKKADQAKKKADKAKKEADKAKKEADAAKKKADEALKSRVRTSIEICQEFGLSKEETCLKVLEKARGFYRGLSENEIREELLTQINEYWKQP